MTGLTPKQIKCIEYLALGEHTTDEIAELIHCNPCTIYKWKKSQPFMEALLSRSRALLRESIPEVYKALSDRSKSGSDRHIKLFLDHLEKLEEVKATRASITFTWEQPEKQND